MTDFNTDAVRYLMALTRIERALLHAISGGTARIPLDPVLDALNFATHAIDGEEES